MSYKYNRKRGNKVNKMKDLLITAAAVIIGQAGILAVPALMLVCCNIIDYVTGMAAAPHRKEGISSYKGIQGITKKVCMWLLIAVGAVMDIMIQYSLEKIGISMQVSYIVSIAVAVWLLVNEIISILENMIDIGVPVPPFLMPLAKNIRTQVENRTDTEQIKIVNNEEE